MTTSAAIGNRHEIDANDAVIRPPASLEAEQGGTEAPQTTRRTRHSRNARSMYSQLFRWFIRPLKSLGEKTGFKKDMDSIEALIEEGAERATKPWYRRTVSEIEQQENR